MAITDTLKKAPRWAWFTAAGVGLGAVAIKVWNDRDAPEPETEPGAEVGTPTYGPGGGSTPGVIVPPVIIGGGGSDPNAGVGVLQELYIGAMGDVIGSYSDLLATTVGQGESILDALLGSIANAGSAPPSNAQQGPVVVVSAPPAPSAPAPVPAPAPPTCAGLFPNYPKHNAANGAPSPRSCYKECCNSRGNRTHCYKDGHKVVPTPARKC